MEKVGPTHQRMRVARRIRGMRQRAGLTLAEAARRLDKSSSALSRLETGQSRMDVHVARSMMALYECPDPDLLDLVRQSRFTG
jgi:transcriptional regulator with XRE-family HTH domain